MKKKSLKLMLQDKCPKTVDIALKWCKAKTNWVNQAYDNYVNIFVDKKDRLEAAKSILGIQRKHVYTFEFHDTIAWHSFNEEETKYWKSIENWVNWFTEYFQFVKSYVKVNATVGETTTAKAIQDRFLKKYDEEEGKKLSEYLLNCAKQQIQT